MGKTAKAISAEVFTTPLFKGCANGGISERYDSVLVLCGDGPIEVDTDNPPENLVRIERSDFSRYVRAVPVAAAPSGTTGWMAGGAIINSSDGRFKDLTGGCPAYLHDHTETWAAYDALSR